MSLLRVTYTDISLKRSLKCLSRARIIDPLPVNADGLVDLMLIWEKLTNLADESESLIALNQPTPTSTTDGTKIKSVMEDRKAEIDE